MSDDTEWKYLHQRHFDVRLRVRMNRIYQQRRQALMELREGLVKAASLVAGSVALANVADESIVKLAALVIFVGTASALVFGWGAKARDAARRTCEWVALERDIDAAGARNFSEAQLDLWTGRCCDIEAAEPEGNAFMLERSYRAACLSLGAAPARGGPWRWVPAFIVP